MSYCIDIQHAAEVELPISDAELTDWATIVLSSQVPTAEITLRFVTSMEITALNSQYRKKNQATNVLAFPASVPIEVELEHPFIGDIIICPSVLLDESHQYQIDIKQHWAHIVIHGILHLFGYDHIESQDEIIMQNLEIQLLKKLGFQNPYKEDNSID